MKSHGIQSDLPPQESTSSCLYPQPWPQHTPWKCAPSFLLLSLFLGGPKPPRRLPGVGGPGWAPSSIPHLLGESATQTRWPGSCHLRSGRDDRGYLEDGKEQVHRALAARPSGRDGAAAAPAISFLSWAAATPAPLEGGLQAALQWSVSSPQFGWRKAAVKGPRPPWWAPTGANSLLRPRFP